MMDYYSLTPTRVWNAIKNPAMRSALFQIWFNRDYTQYADPDEQLHPDASRTGNPATASGSTSARTSSTSYGSTGSKPPEVETVDPYELGQTTFTADTVFGMTGSEAGFYNAPRGLAIAPDGTLYIADTNNNRIQHVTTSGEVIATWGTFADVTHG